MAEAEVSLRLAFHLLEQELVGSDVQVAVDGAQIRTGSTTHFPIAQFLAAAAYRRKDRQNGWQGTYRKRACEFALVVHSHPGRGDVVARLLNGRTLRVESKKGPLVATGSSPEYRLIREALGQLLTVDGVGEDDVLAVAVPESPKFRDLINRWRQAPLVQRLGIHFLTVTPNGSVTGLEFAAI
jgi:hypothetical protein